MPRIPTRLPGTEFSSRQSAITRTRTQELKSRQPNCTVPTHKSSSGFPLIIIMSSDEEDLRSCWFHHNEMRGRRGVLGVRREYFNTSRPRPSRPSSFSTVFADSSSGDDTNELISEAKKKKPTAPKRLSSAKTSSKKNTKKAYDSYEEAAALFGSDSDDEKRGPPRSKRAPLDTFTKRSRMEALKAKRRDTQSAAATASASSSKKKVKDTAVGKEHVAIVQLLDEHEAKKNSTPHTQVLTELDLPQAQVLGELVMEPINKALQEENGRLKCENEVFKERELSKTKEMLLKQELVDEYKARAKNVEEENRRLKEDVISLKEREIAMRIENGIFKRREEELCRREEDLRSDRTMLQTMLSSLMNGIDDRKRKRNGNEETE